jgi:hypothetical protein
MKFFIVPTSRVIVLEHPVTGSSVFLCIMVHKSIIPWTMHCHVFRGVYTFIKVHNLHTHIANITFLLILSAVTLNGYCSLYVTLGVPARNRVLFRYSNKWFWSLSFVNQNFWLSASVRGWASRIQLPYVIFVYRWYTGFPTACNIQSEKNIYNNSNH